MGTVLRRLVAFVLDWIVLFLVLVAPQAAIGLAWDGWPMNDVSNGYLAWGWVVLSVSLPSWIYFTVFDSTRDGATVGKRFLNLAVRNADGGELPRSRALVRTAVKLLPWELTHVMIFLPEPFGDEFTPFKTTMIVVVDALLLTWLAAPFVNPSRKAIHDLAASSVVVNVGPVDAGSSGHRHPGRQTA